MKESYLKRFWKFSICKSGSVFRFDAFGKLVFLEIGGHHFLFSKLIWKNF